MAKQVKIFNATKKIGNIVFNYNKSFDESFADDVIESLTEAILNLKRKKIKIDLEAMEKGIPLNVYIYPTVQQFNKLFYSEIDRRFHSGKKTVGDIYLVQTADGDIHVTVPKGRSTEVMNSLKAALISQILAEYTLEKDKLSIQKNVKETIKSIEEKKNKKEVDEEEIEAEKERQEQEEKERLEEEARIEAEEEEERLSKEAEEEKRIESEELEEDEIEDIFAIEMMLQDENKGDLTNENKIREQKEKEEKNKEAKSWLTLGWVTYRSMKLKNQKNLEQFSEYISKRGVTKFNKLRTTKLLESSRYEKEQACAFVDFLLNTFGRKNFLKVYEDPSILKQPQIFGLTKFVFDAQAKSYIIDRYRNNAKDEKDNIKELVAIDESGDGVIDTTTIVFKEKKIEQVKVKE